MRKASPINYTNARKAFGGSPFRFGQNKANMKKKNTKNELATLKASPIHQPIIVKDIYLNDCNKQNLESVNFDFMNSVGLKFDKDDNKGRDLAKMMEGKSLKENLGIMYEYYPNYTLRQAYYQMLAIRVHKSQQDLKQSKESILQSFQKWKFQMMQFIGQRCKQKIQEKKMKQQEQIEQNIDSFQNIQSRYSINDYQNRDYHSTYDEENQPMEYNYSQQSGFITNSMIFQSNKK